MKNETDSTVLTSPEYRRFIEDLKARVLSARISAARSINGEGTLLYWAIGRAIVEKQRVLGWGESVIDRVSFDLRKAFPDTIGFSPRNLRDMKRFYLTYADEAIWRQLVAKLSGAPAAPNLEPSVPETGLVAKWRQPVAKVRPEDNVIQFLRLLAAEIPWGQNLLILNKLTAPAARLWYLQATARFGWTRNVLLNQIKAGACERAVTDKKTHNFDLALPEHLAEQADEMLKSSYNLELNDKERGPGDQLSIGVILCAEKDEVEVEYALRAKKNPIGVAEYHLQSKLPANLKGKLPTARQLADVVRAELPEMSEA